MFKAPSALNLEQHKNLRFSPVKGYAYADKLTVSPVTLWESRLIARDYPLVFAHTNTMLLALLGIKSQTNAYVDSKGHWQARYIPAHVRRYPFMLGESKPAAEAGKGERTFTVMADLAAAQLTEQKGDLLFNNEGGATPTLIKIQNVLTGLQRDLVRTRGVIEQIAAAGLFEEHMLRVTHKDGKEFVLEGLKSIDKQKLADCPAETLHALHVSGGLALIHAHLISLSNLDDGPLQESKAPTSSSGLMSGETLRLSDIVWNK